MFLRSKWKCAICFYTYYWFCKGHLWNLKDSTQVLLTNDYSSRAQRAISLVRAIYLGNTCSFYAYFPLLYKFFQLWLKNPFLHSLCSQYCNLWYHVEVKFKGWFFLIPIFWRRYSSHLQVWCWPRINPHCAHMLLPTHTGPRGVISAKLKPTSTHTRTHLK